MRRIISQLTFQLIYTEFVDVVMMLVTTFGNVYIECLYYIYIAYKYYFTNGFGHKFYASPSNDSGEEIV